MLALMCEPLGDVGEWCHLHPLEEKVASTYLLMGQEAETNSRGEECKEGREKVSSLMTPGPLAPEVQEAGGEETEGPIHTLAEGMGKPQL